MKIGIDLGGSHIAIGLVEERRIIDAITFYIDDNKNKSVEQYIIDSIMQGINLLLIKNKRKISDITMIGLAVPGTIKDDIIISSANLKLKDFKIKEELLKRINCKMNIKTLNDAKCAAMAEKKYGALKKYEDAVFMCIGTGIGGAVFMNGKLLVPKINSGFEFGHMIIEKDGQQCNCGNKGCLETYCSKKKFKNKLKEILGISDEIKAKELMKLIENNKDNKELQNVINEYVVNLCVGLGNIINIFECEAICIGGSFVNYEHLMFDKVRNELYNGNYLLNKKERPAIIPAEIGNEAGIIGATLIGE